MPDDQQNVNGQQPAPTTNPTQSTTNAGTIGSLAVAQSAAAEAMTPSPEVMAPIMNQPSVMDTAANTEPAFSAQPHVITPTNLSASGETATPIVSDAQPESPSGAPVQPAGSSKRRMPWNRLPKQALIATGVVVALILLGGGAVFGLYLPNTPDGVFSAGLNNTGHMIDGLVDYTKALDKTSYKSSDFDGTVQFQSPGASFDASITGAADTKANLTAQMTTDVMGVKGGAAVRSIHVADDSAPDVYFKITGIKQLLKKVGASSLNGLDGQWLLVDHTLINSYASSLSPMQTSGKITAPTYDQLQDAATKAQVVNRDYLFTTDGATAVLQDQKYLGQVTESGRTLNHYRVGYDRDHLKAYATAMATALDDSALNSWAKSTQDGKKVSQVLQFSQLERDISTAKTNYTFDVWIDTGTRLVSKISLTDPSDAKSVFTIAQAHISGDDYPVTLSMNGSDEDGNAQNVAVTIGVNTATNKLSLAVKAKSDSSDGSSTLDMSLSATPSSKDISVTVPTGAKSISDLLFGLDSGSSVGGSSSPLLFEQ